MSVQKYFETIAHDFDSYYEKPRNWFQDFTNRCWRKPNLLRRLDLSLKAIPTGKPLRILDIGCGSGVAAVPLAQQGHHVLAIDFSEPMLHLAREKAKAANVSVQFETRDFMNGTFETMDVCLALGVLEYFKNPHEFIEKMLKGVCSGGRVIFDIPSLFNLHTPLRLPYLLWRKRPAYFYTERKIRTLLEPLNKEIGKVDIQHYGAGYLIILDKK